MGKKASSKPQYIMRTIDGVTRQVAIKPNPWHKRHQAIIISAAVLIGVAAIISGVMIAQRQDSTQSTAIPDDVSSTIQAIGKHYELPNDEEPALATVTDTTKVSSSFRNLTKNGDRILIYQKNQIAIAYRPSIDKIVTVVPVTIDSPKKTN